MKLKLYEDLDLSNKNDYLQEVEKFNGRLFLRVFSSKWDRTYFRFFILIDKKIYTCHEDEYSFDLSEIDTKIIFTGVYEVLKSDFEIAGVEETRSGVASYNDLIKIKKWKKEV